MSAPEPTSPASPEPAELEWWQQPGMPFDKQPGKWDLVCWVGMIVMGIYGLVMIPLRAWLVVANPVLQAALSGSRSALVVLGVTGNPLWWLGLILGIVSMLKFQWIFFLAGRLWGRNLIEYFLQGRGPRARRNAERAEKLAGRYGFAAVLATYLPIPIPVAVINASVAIAGMSWRRFWIANVIGAVVIQCTWVGLGFWLGEPFRIWVERYAKISGWVALALVVVVFVSVVVRQGRTPRVAR